MRVDAADGELVFEKAGERVATSRLAAAAGPSARPSPRDPRRLMPTERMVAELVAQLGEPVSGDGLELGRVVRRLISSRQRASRTGVGRALRHRVAAYPLLRWAAPLAPHRRKVSVHLAQAIGGPLVVTQNRRIPIELAEGEDPAKGALGLAHQVLVSRLDVVRHLRALGSRLLDPLAPALRPALAWASPSFPRRARERAPRRARRGSGARSAPPAAGASILRIRAVSRVHLSPHLGLCRCSA